MTALTTTSKQSSVSARPMASCRCHPDAAVIPCPRCGGRAYAFRSRPGLARSWAEPDKPGWSCLECGAAKATWRAAA